MTLLARAENAPERMDAADVDRAELVRALDDIVAVNRWLGAARALRKHLPWGLGYDDGDDDGARPATAGSHPRVLDVGTGSGDLATLMAEWARDRGDGVRVVALDLHAGTAAVAGERTAPPVAVVRGNGLRLPFPAGAFDLVHLGMTLHHMDGADLTGLLAEAGRVARGGRVLVSELERSVPNYVGARLLSVTLWAGHRITRHDGPLSVRRSFTPTELLELAEAAGLGPATVHRHPFYRLVLRAEAP